MNKAGFVCIAASAAALLCVGACADMDQLDGTRTTDNLPRPGALRAEAWSSSQSASASSESAASLSEKERRKK